MEQKINETEKRLKRENVNIKYKTGSFFGKIPDRYDNPGGIINIIRGGINFINIFGIDRLLLNIENGLFYSWLDGWNGNKYVGDNSELNKKIIDFGFG